MHLKNTVNRIISMRIMSVLLILCLVSVTTLTGCDISSKHVNVSYEENNNEDISGWDDVNNGQVSDWGNSVTTWDDIDDYSDWVYAQIVFDDIAEEYPIIECKVLDYKSNGKYFDGDKVYELVRDDFDVNSFVTKYAIGTGVIVICVILNVATAGGTTPICCFLAGAAEGSVSWAIKGAAFQGAMGAISTAIKTHGDVEASFYGALESSANGYMVGAMYGAVQGGFSSKYCFTKDTVVLTDAGLIPISDIKEGTRVYSYNAECGIFSFENVVQVMKSETNRTVCINISGETIESTYGHPYYTQAGWTEAQNINVGDQILSKSGWKTVYSVSFNEYLELIDVYNLNIENNHTYTVGTNSNVVHNRCNMNSKAYDEPDHRLKFPEGSANAKKYPKGVEFSKDADGRVWARFEEYATKSVKFDPPTPEGVKNGTCLVGNCSSDFAMANAKAGLTSTPAGYTWHHCEDAQTMLLVPQDVHSVVFGGVAHTGGESVIEAILASFIK